MRIAFVSCGGGHLVELLGLAQRLAQHEQVWILNDPSPLVPSGARVLLVTHAERDARVIRNLLEFAAIFRAVAPDVIVSAGAGLIVPAALVARLAGIPVIYVEPSSTARRLTLTGRLMRPLADRFYVQWEPLARKLRGTRFVGDLL